MPTEGEHLRQSLARRGAHRPTEQEVMTSAAQDLRATKALGTRPGTLPVRSGPILAPFAGPKRYLRADLQGTWPSGPSVSRTIYGFC